MNESIKTLEYFLNEADKAADKGDRRQFTGELISIGAYIRARKETVLEALKEKLAREQGCPYCEVLTPEHRRGFFLPSIDPDCEADMVTISCCPMCGRRLEVEHEKK